MLPCLSNLHVLCVFLLVGGLIKPYGQLLDPTQQCCIPFKSVGKGGGGDGGRYGHTRRVGRILLGGGGLGVGVRVDSDDTNL